MIDKLLVKLIHLFALALGLIPRGLCLHITRAIGDLWFLLDRRHREVVLNNLNLAYRSEKSEKSKYELARTVFRNIAKIPFEIGWSYRLNDKELMEHYDIKGMDNLIAAHNQGKGVILITAHAGNWELLPPSVTSIGYPVSIIYRPLNFKPADHFIRHYRCRFGANLIPKHGSLRRVFVSLKRQECIGILLDQDPGRANGVFVDFFGVPTCTNKGVAFLALKTKAPVIPVFLVRQGLRFLVNIGKEIALSESSDIEADVAANTLAYNKALEEFIRKYPDQWFWVHRRWKRSSLTGFT